MNKIVVGGQVDVKNPNGWGAPILCDVLKVMKTGVRVAYHSRVWFVKFKDVKGEAR